MSEPIRDAETAVRELGALPMPVGSEPQMPSEQRAAIAELIGDAKPATARLVEQLAKSVRDRREHEHPQWEDLYCLNLVSWMGERMGPVLRRLLDAEDRIERRRARLVKAEAELLEMRGLLSPNGERRRIPAEVEIHERVAPAVEWLLNRVTELETELRIGPPWKCPVCSKENTRDACAVCETDRPDPPVQALREDKRTAVCRCDEPDADPYECEADDCSGHFSELDPFGGARPVNEPSAEVSRRCSQCGWRTSVWHVDDGSAEEELHGHVTRVHGAAVPATEAGDA